MIARRLFTSRGSAAASRSGLRAMRVAGTGALIAVLVVGCSGQSESGGATESTASTSETAGSPRPTEPPSKSTASTPSEKAGVVVDITVDGEEISPNGQRIEVARGEPVELRFSTDRPGELHVHSRPEQVVEFPAGESKKTLVVDSPGLVEVEEHETGFVVLQLEVA